jgi:hypothetical protein
VTLIVESELAKRRQSRQFFVHSRALSIAVARRKRGVDDNLCFAQDAAQMILAAKTLGVNLVDVFRAGRSCGKPRMTTPNVLGGIAG